MNIRDFYSGISDFMKGYQSRTNIISNERVFWLQTPRVLWLGGGNHFSQLWNIHGFNNVRQREIQRAVPLVPQTSAFIF